MFYFFLGKFIDIFIGIAILLNVKDFESPKLYHGVFLSYYMIYYVGFSEDREVQEFSKAASAKLLF